MARHRVLATAPTGRYNSVNRFLTSIAWLRAGISQLPPTDSPCGARLRRRLGHDEVKAVANELMRLGDFIRSTSAW